MRLDKTKIIVTGAANGMGAYFAEQLHLAGAQVAVGDVDEAGLETLPRGIHRRRLDVSDEAGVVEFVDWAVQQMGGVNSLVNNAGIIRDGLLVKRDRKTGEVRRLARADWEAVLAVNLTGATLMAREVAAQMIEQETSGVVVNISSLSRHGNRGQSNYVAAKAALAANTVTWAREWARYGIRATAIAPGMVETPMTQGMRQSALDALVAAIPVGRIGTPADLWQAVRFCIECEYFNGRTMDVDGGLVM